jgi:hypothetical protein
VSLTLARGEVPMMVALRLFIPENWTNDRDGWSEQTFRSNIELHKRNWELALAEIDRMIAAGVHFGCMLVNTG